MSFIWERLCFPVEFQGFKSWHSHWMYMKEPFAASYSILFCLFFLSFISLSWPFWPWGNKSCHSVTFQPRGISVGGCRVGSHVLKNFLTGNDFLLVTMDLQKLNMISLKSVWIPDVQTLHKVSPGAPWQLRTKRDGDFLIWENTT